MPKRNIKKEACEEIIEEKVGEAIEAEAEAESEGESGTVSLDEALDALVKEYNVAVADRDKYLNIAQRTAADFDNYRRRNEAIGASRYQDGISAAVERMLPVMDNFERAILAAEENEHSKALLEGVKMVFRQLSGELAKLGCIPMETPRGTAFDPNIHNAMMTVECGEGDEAGTIEGTFQTGYIMNGKVIRHANVRVFA